MIYVAIQFHFVLTRIVSLSSIGDIGVLVTIFGRGATGFLNEWHSFVLQCINISHIGVKVHYQGHH